MDDYNDDVKKGRFNLINTMQGDVSDKLQKEHIEKCCVIVRLIQFKIMTSCESILENEIIKNIVFYGIENVTSNVLRNTQKFRKK